MKDGLPKVGTFRPTVAQIDLGRLAANFQKIKSAVNDHAFVCPMVKANAYGHGDVEVSKKLRSVGAQHLGVGLIEEGLRLRAKGDTGSILHFGMFDLAGAAAMIESHLTPVISSMECLENFLSSLRALPSSVPRNLHLKINTGMNRLGLSAEDLPRVATRIAESVAKHEIVFAGLGTHFANGEDLGLEGGASDEQMVRLRIAERSIRAAGLKGFQLHVANSSAALSISRLRKSDSSFGDLGIRPGLALYGVEPDSVPEGKAFGLSPVLQLLSRIEHIQNVRKGEGVSYGLRWKATRNSRIGIVPCGYADGYRRGIANGTVIVGGRIVPITGTICMDYFMCDLTEVEFVIVGDQVTLIGEANGLAITAKELSERAQTIPYEIFTGIGERIPRVYNDDVG